jgi:hypothetical protein
MCAVRIAVSLSRAATARAAIARTAIARTSDFRCRADGFSCESPSNSPRPHSGISRSHCRCCAACLRTRAHPETSLSFSWGRSLWRFPPSHPLATR